MHFEPHAALGWAIGNLGGADHRLRKWCVIGAILPDLDAVTYLFGIQIYGRWHHTFGHNVFLWGFFVGWVTFRCRSWRALLLSFLSFGSHLLTDAQFSGWNLQLFWPFSTKGYLFPTAVGLAAPINTQLVYCSFLLVGLLGLLCQRTPIDLFSPRLDRLLLSVFQKKALECSECARRANQVCCHCGAAICLHHCTVEKGVLLSCPGCAAGKAIQPDADVSDPNPRNPALTAERDRLVFRCDSGRDYRDGHAGDDPEG